MENIDLREEVNEEEGRFMKIKTRLVKVEEVIENVKEKQSSGM